MFNSLKITIHQADNDTLAHCLILMFMALCFLDDAFEDVATPAELYSKRNPGSSDLLIRFRSKIEKIPVLRRLEDRSSFKLSPTLAWSAGSALNEGQRIARDVGFPQRFTFYNIRRAVANAVDGKAQRY